MSKSALILGSSIGCLQAALDLADSGISVHVVELSPFLRGGEPGSSSDHLMNTRFLDILRHPHIHTWTNSSISGLDRKQDRYQVEITQEPRYVDLTNCTACGDCVEVCPVTVPAVGGRDNHTRSAIYLDGQPGCAFIQKPGKSPCASACPGGIHVQGYVALIRKGRYAEAYSLIHDSIPFPSVCGRVCNHYCEAECTRQNVDESLNIMALKRFVSDWAYDHPAEIMASKGAYSRHKPVSTGKAVAIIGAGPAGLTAARELVRQGHKVTVFDSLPAAGGMMRVGIPPHRLSTTHLDWEIGQIIEEGVDLILDTWIDDIPGLLENEFDAALIATGAHKAKKLPIRNSNHPDNLLSLDVLRRVCLGEGTRLKGKNVIVLGGGNVALDTVRTVLRLGANEVRMVCLEPRGEMPGFEWEVAVAEEEGVTLFPGRTFKEVVLDGDKISGVLCAKVDFNGFVKGRPNFSEIPGSDHTLPADVVIWAIGQEANFSFLPQDGSIDTRFPIGIRSDENMMTTLPGVFVAGDVHRGMTFFVIDAIGEGQKAALAIDRYLKGDSNNPAPSRMKLATLNEDQIRDRFRFGEASPAARTKISSIALDKRINNFREVDQSLTEMEAQSEASRCLSCGVCSECLACLEECKAGAINHGQTEQRERLDFQVVIADDNFDQDIDLSVAESEAFYRIPAVDPLLGSAVAAVALKDIIRYRQPLPIAAAPLEKSGAPRIGVFICECWGDIAEVINIGDVCNQVRHLPEAIHVQALPTSCSLEAAEIVKTAVHKNDIDRVVLAACSCCNIDQVCYSCTYQRTRCKANLGLFTPVSENWNTVYPGEKSTKIEFVNIREQCAWVHPNDPKLATEKAAGLITSAVARSKAAPGVLAGARPIEKSTILIGSGNAASTCNISLNWSGITVHSIESIPTSIERNGGLFLVNLDGKIIKGSTIILVPVDQAETNGLLEAFGRERRRPKVHPDWGGLETHRPGVFMIQPSQNPQIAGTAVAARVIAWISRTESRPPIAAIVDSDRCRACKTCIDTCEYCAPEIVEIDGRYTSWIDPAICTSCGTCAAHCPSGAISAGCSTDAQLEAMFGAILSI